MIVRSKRLTQTHILRSESASMPITPHCGLSGVGVTKGSRAAQITKWRTAICAERETRRITTRWYLLTRYF